MDQLTGTRRARRIRRGPVRGRDGGVRGGFTLLEVMVALGILAVGLLAVAAAELYAMRGGTSGRHTSDAAAIAHSQIDSFERYSWTDASMNATGGWTPAGGQVVQDQVQADPAAVVEMSYRVQWRITDLSASLKAIDVRVTWDEPNRPNRTVTISTVRHDDLPTQGGA
jgi:prepilin-type N-terminal cleavage/methylation domain-containing protein